MHIDTDPSGQTIEWVSTDTADTIAQVLHITEPQAAEAVMELPTVGAQLLSAMHRLGVPTALFGGTFALAMFGMQFLVTPDRFPVRVGDKVVQLSQLLSERAAIQSVQAQLLSQDARDTAVPTPVIQQVRALKGSAQPVSSAIYALDRTIARIGRTTASVTVDQLSCDGKTIRLSGTVEDKDGKAIESLASFVDALRERSDFASVSEPEYAQTLQGDGSAIASFSLLLTLRVH